MPGLWAVQTESAGMLELPQSRHMKVQPASAGSVAQVGMTALLVSAVLTGMLGLLVSAVLVGMPASAARLAIRVVWAAQAVLPESQVLGEPEALLAWMVLQGAGSRTGNRHHCWS
ncbi:hypothetical protein HMPREF3193_00527 [Bifidobacterium breve]|nr:hypothetical protein HMPREF1587_00565 [Bifidobacterium breve JCP7499]KWZ86346.1 hypothetical protein HMPREF3193_00527 [Bifidobacterium breve]